MVNFRREGEKPPSGIWPVRRRAMKAATARRRALGRVLVALLAASSLCAQSNRGELRLKVTDPAGLGIKSSVELVSEANQFNKTYSTNSDGNLEAEFLPFGLYQIHVERHGLAPFAVSLEIRSFRLSTTSSLVSL
jgi:hypothetical protein